MGICACFHPDISNATLTLYPSVVVFAQGEEDKDVSQLNYDLTSNSCCDSQLVAIFPDGSIVFDGCGCCCGCLKCGNERTITIDQIDSISFINEFLASPSKRGVITVKDEGIQIKLKDVSLKNVVGQSLKLPYFTFKAQENDFNVIKEVYQNLGNVNIEMINKINA